MATTTTTGAKKIENSDQWGEIFDIHNDTVEAYDQLHEDTVEDYDDKIDDLSNAMGIVETGDVATHAIEAGQYVIWKRALYTADAAITIGETLAATGGSKNLTAVEKGGLNALNASMTELLWTNPSPASGYSGTDICTVTNHNIIIVLLYGSTALVADYGPGTIMIMPKGGSGFISDGVTYYATIEYTNAGVVRIKNRVAVDHYFPMYVIGL